MAKMTSTTNTETVDAPNPNSNGSAHREESKKYALVLQGGGAIGAYQAGIYETLQNDGVEITHIGGVSIGAVNTALIAGNPPEKRVKALRTYWDRVSSSMPIFPFWPDTMRYIIHDAAAQWNILTGAPGMFKPRPLSPYFAPPGTPAALSFYDTEPLRQTLNELVDWDLLNDGPVRVGIGATHVEKGDLRYFDNRKERLDVRHIMASSSLPPGFPPTAIDGDTWWDGGVVSNTPLSWLLATQDSALKILQVDLFSAHGNTPRTINDVSMRHKEIQYASRTELVLDLNLKLRERSKLEKIVLDKLPADLKDDPDVKALAEKADMHPLHIGRLIYSAKPWEDSSRDYEFSRRSVVEHWEAGKKGLTALREKAQKSNDKGGDIYGLVAH